MSFDDNTTTYDYQSHITTTNVITTEEFSTSDIFTTPFSNNSCYPNCYIITKPPPTNVALITKLVYSLAIVLVFVITISVVVFLRHYQHSRKQKKEEKECLQVR